MERTPRVIGIDFDNTLVNYDAVLRRVAAERGFALPGAAASKRVIRDLIRQQPDGEREWQRVQAVVYGSRMDEAVLSDGVPAFLRDCRERGIRVVVVSHKTEFAPLDPGRTNLREAALAWMTRQGFFEPGDLGFSRTDVFFEPTRAEKISRIRQAGCTHFIDDLEETFLEPSFPAEVEKLLYAAHGREPFAGATVVRTWQEIAEALFHAGSCRAAG